MSTRSLIPHLLSAYVTVYVTVYIAVVTTAADSTTQDEKLFLPYLPNMTEIIESLNMTGIDYSNLLTEYSKICPSMLPQCGSPCKCQPWCIHDNDCCPDCPYTFLKRGCFNVAIVGEPAFHKLINECPLNFAGDEGLKNLCASNDSDISPVTYMVFGFKNKHCAECHGLKEHDYEPWDMVLECKKPLPSDFKLNNLLVETYGCVAKFEAPFYTLRCNNAVIRKNIDRCNVTRLWMVKDPGLRWACENLDSLPGFGMFRNVYCYLCNPSIASTTKRMPLQGCRFNFTCEPDLFSKRLFPYGNYCKAMCYGVGPFIEKLDVNSVDKVDIFVSEKLDIHTGMSTMGIKLSFHDTNTILSAIKPFFTEVYNEDILPKKDISTERFDDRHSFRGATPQKLHKIYTSICGEFPVCTYSINENIDDGNHDDNYNITENDATHIPNVENHDLVLQAVKTYNIQYANRQLFSVNLAYKSMPKYVNPACRTDCSCDSDCLHSDNCCIDILLQKQPFSCYSNEYAHVIYPTKHKASLAETSKPEAEQNVSYFSMVDTCLNETSEYLTNMCIGSGKYVDSLSHICVTSDTLVFKNIYCLLCNIGRHIRTNVIRFELECDSYLERDLFPDLRTMLLVARTSCKTRFLTDYLMPCKQAYKTESFGDFYTREPAIPFRLNDVEVFSKCNMTGLWTNYDIYIQEICEGESESILRLPEYRFKTNVYKNFACYECNPDISTNGVNVISSCTGEQANENDVLTTLCNRHPLHKRWYPYKNFYCAQCNQPPIRLLNIQEWEEMIPMPTFIVKAEAKLTLTYRYLFSLESVTRTEGLEDDGSSCAGIYDAEQKKCREFQCGEDRILVNNTCQTIQESHQPYELADNFLSTTFPTYLMRIRVRPEQTFDEDIPPTVLLETLCNDLLNSVWENLNREHFVLFDCIVNNASCDEVGIPIGNLSFIALTYSVEVIVSNIKVLEEVLVDALTGSYVIGTTHGSNVSLKAFPISKTERFYPNLSTCSFAVNNTFDQSIDTFKYVDKFLNCPHVVVNETDVDIDSESGVITLRSDGSSFTANDFDRVDNGFMICEEDYTNDKKAKTFLYESDSYEKAYKIFNDVCIILSLICLLMTFVTYSIFKKMRTTPGKNIMTLTFTLFLAQLLILIAPIISTSLLSCVTLGALVHYFWLSTFSAMCACSLHIFKSFYLGSLSAPGSVSKHIVAKYNTFVFGVPLAIVFAYITYHMTTGNGFSGYSGDYFCFIRDFYSLLSAFILPSIAINIACIALFSVSFHRIRTSPNMAVQRDRNDVMICIKLCIIVGITWPLQVVDGILELSALSFIVTGLNALQGVFIFFAYICNVRTAKLYKGLLFTKRSSSNTADTKSSQATRPTENATANTAV